MSRDELRDLWGRYVCGGSLSDPEREALLRGLQDDAGLRDEALEDVDLHGLLRSSGRDMKDGERFLQSIAEYLGKERQATRFIQKLQSRMTDEGGPRPPPVVVGARRIWTPRRGTRLPRATGDSSPRAAWLFAVLAAGVLLGLVALSAVVSRPSAARNPEARRPLVERDSEGLERPEGPKLVLPPQDLVPVAKHKPPPRAETEEERKERIDREFRERTAATRKGESAEPSKDQPRPPKETPRIQKAEGTVAEVARLERVEGDVLIVRKSGIEKAKVGQLLVEAGGIETLGPKSRALVVHPDRTLWELGPESKVSNLSDRSPGGKAVRGKSLFVERGIVVADVAPQPQAQPFLILTPHGEARVMGTTLRITVTSDPKAGTTRLEVAEGKVRLSRLDGKAVDVVGGHFAVAAAGVDFASKPIPTRLQQESVLARRPDVILFEDFEQDNWKRHWSSPSEVSKTSEDRTCTFLGRRALEVRPKVDGWHRLTIPGGYARVHMRMYVYFPQDFLASEGLTLLQVGALPAGPQVEEGFSLWMDRTPNGRDFFKVALVLGPRWTPRFYYYHPDQTDPKGDGHECDPTGSVALVPGSWHCVELMCQANEPGRKNGVLRAWIDGSLCGEVQGIRFRDAQSLLIREMGLVGIPAGDRSYFIDDVVVARDYIGPVLGEFTVPALPKK